MEIKYNDTFSTSHSSDDVFDFIEKDTTILKGSRNESTSLPKSTEVNSNETLSSGYKPQSVQLDKPESPLVEGTVVEVKPILLSDPDVNTKAAFAKSHTRDFYKGRSFRYAGKWEEGVHYINDEYITDFVVKDGVLLVCKKSNMSSWSNEPTEWVYDGDQIISIISDYWEVVLVGGLRGKTYLPEYDEDSDSLVWKLVDPTDLPEEFQTYLGIKDYIDYALVPIQEDLADINSDIDITKRDIKVLERDVISLGNDLTNLEIITGRISTHVENLEGDFSDFVQTAEGFFYKVGDLENNVGQLWLTSQQFGVQLENAEGDISRLTIQADQISTRVENAEGDISQINQRADEISTQVENQQGDISRISQRADQIQSEVENQQGDISRITQRADVIESQVQNLDGDVSTISQRADEIQSQVENVEGDISTITQRADIIESQVESQAGDISRISQTADQIQSEVFNLQGDVSTITQRADLIESQVQDVEGDVSTISQRADSIELEVLNQQGDISDIRQTADDINLRVENAEGDIASLDVRADQITSTVADQQGQISQIRQTSEEIASEVAANKVDADNKYTETNSRITQTAAEINLEVARVEGKVDTNARTFAEAVNDLQNQIDGAIDTWFYDYAPVHTDEHGVPDSQVPLNVAPYSEWVAAETVEEPEKVRDSHVSDIFYDQHSGYAYRFIGTGNPGSRVYTWVVIQDSAVIKALEDAARAQDTADNKRRVFVATPYAPYDLGDLWVKTTTVGNVAATELYRCIIAKTTAGTENIATDWAVADSYAKEVSKSNIQILADAIVQQTVHYEYDEYGRLTNDTKSAITTGMNDISLAITGSKLETVGIFIRNASVNDNYINLIADKVKIKGTGDHTPTALGIDWDPNSQSYKISAANLQVEGAFSTTAWDNERTGVLSDAATAATGPTGYLTEALYGSGGSAASPTGGVYGTINPMTTALSNFTTITGGLILTTELILGQQTGQSWVPWAGMSGAYDARTEEHGGAIGHGIAAWYGGDCVDKAALTAAQIAEGWNIHRWARTLFRMDGSGYLADRAIYWSDEGDLHLNTNIVLGDSSGNPTINSILTFMAKFGSWFVQDTTTMTGKTLLRINMGSQQGTGFDGLIFDGFLISGGDQIVGSGTPGGGGGGGASSLWQLDDVNVPSEPALIGNGQMLAWDSSISKWVNVNAPTGSITSVALAQGATNGTLHLTVNGTAQTDIAVPGWSSKADVSALTDYVKVSASGTQEIVTTTSDTALSVKSATNTSYLGFKNSSGTWLGWFGYNASGEPTTYKNNVQYAIWHAGNFTPSNYLPLTGGTLSGALDVTATAKFNSGYFANTNPALGNLDNGTVGIYAVTYGGSRKVYGIFTWVDYNNGTGKIQCGYTELITAPLGLALQPLGGAVGIGYSGDVRQLGYTLAVNGTINATTIYQNGVVLGARAFDSTDYQPLATAINTGNIGSQSVTYAVNATRLYASDSPYRYGDSVPYYAYFTYNNFGDNRWYMRVSPATPADIRVDYASIAGSSGYAAYVTSPYAGFDQPSGTITDSTTSDSMQKAFKGTLYPVFHTTDWGWSDTLYWSGYDKWGGTELATQYNAGSNVRVKIRKYYQGTNAWGSWTEFFTSGNANKSDVAWTCSTLQAYGVAHASCGYFYNTTPSLGYLNNGTCAVFSTASSGSRQPYGKFEWVDYYTGYVFIQTGRTDGNTTTYPLCLNALGGNVGIGTATPSYKLHVAGLIASTGDQVITSDESKKNIVSNLSYTLDQIANAPTITFDWKDGSGHSFGSIAQYWKPICPEMVLGEEGNYSLAYAQGAFTNGIIIAREVKSLKDKLVPLFEKYEPIFNKVNTHEDRINELNQKLELANQEISRLKSEINNLRGMSYGIQ